MKGSRGISVVTVLLVLAGSVLTLFTAGCVNVSLTKSADRAQAAPGESVTYIINVNNSGDPISGAVVTDRLDQNLEGATEVSSGGTYDPSTRTVTWRLGNMSTGSQAQLSFRARVLPTAAAGTNIANSASLAYSGVVPSTPTPSPQALSPLRWKAFPYLIFPPPSGQANPSPSPSPPATPTATP